MLSPRNILPPCNRPTNGDLRLLEEIDKYYSKGTEKHPSNLAKGLHFMVKYNNYIA